MNHGLERLLGQLMNGESLSEEQSETLMTALAAGSVEPALAGALLVALSMKGESAEEVRGFANGMRKVATEVKLDDSLEPIDIVGTGGDGLKTLNISTAASIVVAGQNIKVAKHGNRSVSSLSGASDILDELNLSLIHI